MKGPQKNKTPNKQKNKETPKNKKKSSSVIKTDNKSKNIKRAAILGAGLTAIPVIYKLLEKSGVLEKIKSNFKKDDIDEQINNIQQYNKYTNSSNSYTNPLKTQLSNLRSFGLPSIKSVEQLKELSPSQSSQPISQEIDTDYVQDELKRLQLSPIQSSTPQYTPNFFNKKNTNQLIWNHPEYQKTPVQNPYSVEYMTNIKNNL